MRDAERTETPTFKLVSALLDRFATADAPLTLETDLAALTADDPEDLEWALGDLQKSLRLEWPKERDAFGFERSLQLVLPVPLTVAMLCDVVDSGAWPKSWTQPGKRLLPFMHP